VLEKYGVELIGASREAIDKAEDREKFRNAMTKIGLGCPRSGIAHSMEEALQVQGGIGFPVIIRPSSRWAAPAAASPTTARSSRRWCKRGLEASPTNEVLIEESVLGWKEYEMEVVRDRADNCIIVCSIENLDPMGVHTGDSITVAPAQTLTDKEYQIMRNASIAVLREIGVDTGGSNVQFAVNPPGRPHDRHRDEPARVALLGAGLQGHRLPDRQGRGQAGGRLHAGRAANDITGGARRRPSSRPIDYVVTKIPRFTFEKFPAGQRPPDHPDEVGGRGDGHRAAPSRSRCRRRCAGWRPGVYGLDEVDTDRETLEHELRQPGPSASGTSARPSAPA
jgi:carbamoyl-phosphate synthase large subunit